MIPVSSLIERAIAAHAFPAAAIEVGRHDRVVWNAAFGRLTYAPDAPATAPDTIFDLASLTKVICTTTLMMRAVDAGLVALEDRVADRLADWRGPDREQVTIADLLEHASGLTAYLPFFRDHRGRAEFERAIGTLPLEYAPRTQSIYSDLGFMLLAFILEDVHGLPIAAQFDRLVRDPIFRERTFRLKAEATGNREGAEAAGDRIESLHFRLKADATAADTRRYAPTELDLWRGRLLRGEVHDENAWALGGAAGHAGLFGTAASVGVFAQLMLEGLRRSESSPREGGPAPPETMARFVRKTTVPGSSRALGWDTMLPTSSCGTRLSPHAIGHTGFTGTSLWIDPAQDLYVVLLTNRVHPTRENHAIQSVRRAIHDAVVGSLS